MNRLGVEARAGHSRVDRERRLKGPERQIPLLERRIDQAAARESAEVARLEREGPLDIGQRVRVPADQVIGDSLQLNHERDLANGRADTEEKELQLIYQVDEKIRATSRSPAGLAPLIGQSGRFLGIAYTVLLLPSKRIRIRFSPVILSQCMI